MSPRQRFWATGTKSGLRGRNLGISLHFSNSARRNAALSEVKHILRNFSRMTDIEGITTYYCLIDRLLRTAIKKLSESESLL
jgi:hypothetical protein